MKFRSVLTAVLLLTGVCSYSASATPVASFTGETITSSNSTQLGRPSRNNQPQTWTGAEAYPGVAASSTATTFYYKTYTVANAAFTTNPYLEISFTDTNVSGLLFISAYFNSYNPGSRNTNWLGDLGFNSAAYGGDSLTFQVLMPYASNLVLVVNTTGGSMSGTGNPFDIYVNGYSDTSYDEAAPLATNVTPEPSTFIELGTGMLAAAGMVRRRMRIAA